MYAIIQDGGKQYKVVPGQAVEVERKPQNPGDQIEFTQVVFYKNEDDVQFGTPFVDSMKVKGVVERELRGDKITVFKFRRRKDSHQKKGHRQYYTRVRVQKIVKE